MPNPIADSTTQLLAELDPEDRFTAERDLAENSVRPAGFALSLAEELNLAKAVKYVASVDGLSREELAALEFLMIMSALPYWAQQHVRNFDTTVVTLEQVAELFPPGSQKACYLLSGAATVSAIDGLSDEEEKSARELARKLALPDKLVNVLIAEARATGLAMRKGDQELVSELKRLRQALFGYF
jgi:tellurite resistance protein